MPLIKGKSPEAFSHNIKAEMHSGKPQNQALAVAYAVKRKAQHKKKMAMGGYADGGPVLDPDKAQSFQDSFRAALGHSKGGKVGYWEGGYADGGEVENEELHPEHRGENPMPMDGVERLSYEEQAHDGMYKPYAKESSYHEYADEEDHPSGMSGPDVRIKMGYGGMTHPSHIVDKIMAKRHKMYSGGMLKQDNFLDSDVDDSDERYDMHSDVHPDNLQKENWSLDNEEAPANDYLEDGENEDMKKKRRRAMIQDLMHSMGENEP